MSHITGGDGHEDLSTLSILFYDSDRKEEKSCGVLRLTKPQLEQLAMDLPQLLRMMGHHCASADE